MKEIPLNHGKVALVDDEDFEWLLDFHWYAINNHRKGQKDHWYAATCVGGRKNRKTIMMHRLLCPGVKVDHWDRNGLNNQRANLRPATRTQNNANMGKRMGSHTSKFKGVSWESHTRKWRAQIHKQGQHIGLGRYDNEASAAAAYDAAAKELFGAFSLTNAELFRC